jgi:hypothetical protein
MGRQQGSQSIGLEKRGKALIGLGVLFFIACAQPMSSLDERQAQQRETLRSLWGALHQSVLHHRLIPSNEKKWTPFLTETLYKVNPQLATVPLEVVFLKSFLLPGWLHLAPKSPTPMASWLAIERQALQKIEYEHELAAFLSLLCVFAEFRALDALVLQQKAETQPGPFYYWLVEWDAALTLKKGFSQLEKPVLLPLISRALEMLVLAQFDPRGLQSFLVLSQNNPSFSFFKAEQLIWLLEFAQKEASAFPPLRNPIVRTDQFLEWKAALENQM